MVRTAIQLQTLDSLAENLLETIARIGTTTLDGVEFAGLDEASPKDVSDALAAASVEPLGAHVSLAQLEAEYDALIDAYEQIGCRRLIVADRYVDAFTSVTAINRLAERMNRISKRLAEDGFDLSYHNDMVEFERVGGELAYDVFVDALDDAITLEVDTGLVQYAGVNPITLMERHADRVTLVHLTDTVPGSAATVNVELGAGELDVEACVKTARSIDIAWIVYEHSRTSDPSDSLTHAETKLSMLCHEPDEASPADSAYLTD